MVVEGELCWNLFACSGDISKIRCCSQGYLSYCGGTWKTVATLGARPTLPEAEAASCVCMFSVVQRIEEDVFGCVYGVYKYL
ncbi:hypothetical protein M8J76_007539 [Diaphorina citri]|nr:hypothetical protein M8J76_007539 [Diaphorina citri]